jgi:hypothetical protein
MTKRPHSVEPRPACVEGDVYAGRNSFLLLLLGVISTAERVLEVIPGLTPEPPETPPPRPPRPPERTLFR